MSDCIYAFTPPTNPYPPYLNLTTTDAGEIIVTVRGSAEKNWAGHPDVGKQATIALSLPEIAQLHDALAKYLDLIE